MDKYSVQWFVKTAYVIYSLHAAAQAAQCSAWTLGLVAAGAQREKEEPSPEEGGG
jgi:hypothetical protein